MTRQIADFAPRPPLRRRDLPGLCARFVELLEREHPCLSVCHCATLAPADAVTVDALARLALIARRHGCRLQLADAGSDLRELLRLAGLERELLAGTGTWS